MKTVLKGNGQAGAGEWVKGGRILVPLMLMGLLSGRMESSKTLSQEPRAESDCVDQAQSHCGWVLTLRISHEME